MVLRKATNFTWMMWVDGTWYKNPQRRTSPEHGLLEAVSHGALMVHSMDKGVNSVWWRRVYPQKIYINIGEGFKSLQENNLCDFFVIFWENREIQWVLSQCGYVTLSLFYWGHYWRKHQLNNGISGVIDQDIDLFVYIYAWGTWDEDFQIEELYIWYW